MDLKNQDSEGSEHGQQRHLQQQQQQHFHVLAVDDSVIDRKLLERLLTVSSYQVTCVESGDKALEYLGLLTENNSTPSSSSSSCSSSSHTSQQVEGSKVHLIMTDYSMPGMSGYDLLRRVKGSSCKDVPVVVMSSENIPSRINMCLEGGAEEFLLKPVKLSDLSKLQSHLVNSPSHSCKEMERNFVVVEDDDNEEKNENEENNSNEMSPNCTNYKRKAMPTPALIKSTERLPEMKELAVL